MSLVRPSSMLLLALVVSTGVAQPVSAATDLLIDQFGRPVHSRELNGHWLLVYFGYASCQEICPAALSTLSQLLTRLGPLANSIDPLFITLDPAHDSPAVLKTYLAHFNPRIRALTGSLPAVTDAARTFSVPWKNTPSEGLTDHGTLFYVVAPDGRVVQLLHPQQPLNDLVAAVAKRINTTSRD